MTAQAPAAPGNQLATKIAPAGDIPAEIIEEAQAGCARCGMDDYGTPLGKAVVVARMPSGLAIALCNSCGEKHQPALIEQDAVVYDLRTPESR